MKPEAFNTEKSEAVQQDYKDHIQCASVKLKISYNFPKKTA